MVKLSELYQMIKVPAKKRAQLVVLAGDPQINAFALPTGVIAISGGAIRRLPLYNEVWQALLAHEQNHLTKQHSRKLRKRVAQSGEGFLREALRSLSFRRLMETQSDLEGGVFLLNRAGINPFGSKVLLQAFQESEKRGWHLAEHGSALDRVLNVETVFAFYDLKALSDQLTPIGLNEELLDVSQKSKYRHLLPRVLLDRLPGTERVSCEGRRTEVVQRANFLESLLFLERFSEGGDDEIAGICRDNIDRHLRRVNSALTGLEREALTVLMVYLAGEKDDPY